MPISLDEIEVFFENFLAPSRIDKVYTLTDRIRALEDLIGSMQLYIRHDYVLRQLTTEQKELFDECVEAWRSRVHADDPGWKEEQP